ncbi:MAG TPA: AAA family ATPase [Candidatus Hydrogenedentes bacterium]|nr:AAA family ATPase [Candidatus Hydrogenedentota bacterium]HPC16868.1 AAA family ATPase [Candidatus Hydrogenedentota bacterium]HRT22154.1 AAA family ATPase [Candidatus Hydrogenedentota bacterium]HRT22161.1 AAA family ATPase [Candidatus Hydrogenedentota bacterium]HRT66995.1 AAA family ATPase [Candidatus Hydrogenedentota bacterium]
MTDTPERHDIELLKNELAAAGAIFHGKECRCPFHEDRRASAGVYLDSQGVARFKCHGCGVAGDLYDIRARIHGVDLREVLPKSDGGPRNGANKSATLPQERRSSVRQYETLAEIERAATSIGRIEARHDYTDGFAVFRIVGADGVKTFRQAHREYGKWQWGKPRGLLPLYGREHIGETEDPVVVVEGEKCVDALWKIGTVAVTSAMGAGKAHLSDWTPLDNRDIVLWPDNDPPGCAHMDQVAGILKTATRLRIVNVEILGLPPKGDVADLLEKWRDDPPETKRAAIYEILANAKPVVPSGGLAALIEGAIGGTRKAISLPWGRLSKLTRALLPGSITLIVGPPGCGKSFLLLQLAYALHKSGVPISVFELEEDKAHHLHRLLAQLANDARLLDLEWIAGNPENARAALAAHQADLDAFACRLFDAPDKQPTLTDLARWVSERAAAGNRVIAIDPLSVADMGGEPWRTAPGFITEASAAIRKHGASLILTYHPRKGAAETGLVSLDGIAGAASFTRLVQTVLWLERHADDHRATVQSIGGPFEETANRTVHILKSRNAPGQGCRIAFHFDPETLTFEEHGIEASYGNSRKNQRATQ